MRLKLHWQILIALVLAVAAGYTAGREAAVFGISWLAIFDFFGDLFLNALKMIIVPLVVSSIITGIANASSASGLGRMGAKTFTYYMTTSLIAILVGLMMVNLLSPGIIDGRPALEVLGLDPELGAAAAAKVEGRGAGEIVDVILSIIPPNIVAAAVEGQMLGLIFFSILVGYFVNRIDTDAGRIQIGFWQGLFAIMMRITDLIMRFAPIGVFGLVASIVAGLEGPELAALAGSLAVFAFSVAAGLAVHAFVVLPLILRYVARVSPLRHYRAMAPALLTAFSTASSSATLPLTMDCVEKNAGVSNRTSSVVLPLGATVNMDGTALYECVAAIFIAQAYGLDLSVAQQFTIVLIALLTSIGVAAVPAASLVAIAIILSTIGLPAEGIGLLLAVDRVLDMLRTSVNVFSDTCGAVVIARSEGEENILVDDNDRLQAARVSGI